MFHRSIPAREHQQAADLQYFNINSRHPTHIVSSFFFATIFSDSRNLFLLATFPGLQRSKPPATTCQVAEDSLHVSVGRRAPGATRARQQPSHKRAKKKGTASISKCIDKHTDARQTTASRYRHPRRPSPALHQRFHPRLPKCAEWSAPCPCPCPQT